MKKKILCLVLCLIFLPSLLVFSACNEEEVYDLNNLVLQYISIAENKTSLQAKSSLDNGNNIYKLEYNYDHFVYKEQKYFNNLLNLDNYSQIKNYNNILYNTLEFVSFNISRCSNNELQVDNATKNDIKAKLDDLTLNFNSMENSINTFARLIASVQDVNDFETQLEKPGSVYLEQLYILFDEYNELIHSAYNFSNALTRIYFKAVATSPDFSIIDNVNEENSTIFLSVLNERIRFQKANLSYYYLLNDIETDGINDSTYASYVQDIKKVTPTTNFAEKLSGCDFEEFKKLALKLFNIQCSFDNEFEIFTKANSEIDYNQVKNNLNATNYEILCAQIIENHNFLTTTYSNAVYELRTFLGDI